MEEIRTFVVINQQGEYAQEYTTNGHGPTKRAIRFIPNLNDATVFNKYDSRNLTLTGHVIPAVVERKVILKVNQKI